MRVMVRGTGPDGLLTAVLLADDGHEVTVVGEGTGTRADEADDDVPHLLVPAVARLLGREAPTLATALIACAGSQQSFEAHPANSRSAGPGTEVHLLPGAAVREILTGAVRRHPGIRWLPDTGAESLIMGNELRSGRPHVRGVLTDDGRALFTDVCVDAGRVPMDDLLSAAGTQAGKDRVGRLESRMYTRRFMPTADSADSPAPLPSLALYCFGSLCVRVVRAPDAWTVTLCIGEGDEEMYSLAQPVVWDRVAAALGPTSGLGDAVPVQGVRTSTAARSMGQRMHMPAVPTVTGFASVGTAWASFHPLYGPQFSLGALHAVVLRDALRDTRDGNAAERTDRFEELTEAFVVPVHHRMLQWELRLRGRTDTVVSPPPGEGQLSAVTHELLRWIDRMEDVTGTWRLAGPDRVHLVRLADRGHSGARGTHGRTSGPH